jgi:hypothetical protein
MQVHGRFMPLDPDLLRRPAKSEPREIAEDHGANVGAGISRQRHPFLHPALTEEKPAHHVARVLRDRRPAARIAAFAGLPAGLDRHPFLLIDV